MLTCVIGASAASAEDDFWTHSYAGVAFGGAWSHAGSWVTSVAPSQSSLLGTLGLAASQTGDATSNIAPDVTLEFGKSAFVSDRVLFGLEGEVAYTPSTVAYSTSATFSNSRFFGANLLLSETAQDVTSARLSGHWSGAMRLRLSYLATDRLLIFGAAGPVLASTSLHAVHNESGLTTGTTIEFPAPGVASLPFASTGATEAGGPVAGFSLSAGGEYRMSERLSLRCEYVYSRFQALSVAAASSSPFPRDYFSATPVIETVRAGLVYHF